MTYKIIILGVALLLGKHAVGQTLSDYIDGAKVAIDVIKLNKEKNREKDSTLV
jgi:hypothetical protein